MQTNKRDNFGDRMKMYEGNAEVYLMPGLPIVVRLDGKGFSKYTKKMTRPYDENFSLLMQDTCKHLMKRYPKIVVGYAQSDEISLVLKHEFLNPVEYNGRLQKLCSLLASEATSFFAVEAYKRQINPNHETPTFDCRIFQVPSWIEASNAILWREQDATKNSIQQLGQYYFSHKQLHKLNGKQIQEKLLLEKDINWNSYPTFFKRGTYVQRVLKETQEQNAERKEIKSVYFKEPLTFYPLEERLQLLFGDIHE